MRAALFVVVILGQSASAGFGAQTPDRPRDQYETLIRDWDEYSRQAEKEWEEATSDEAKRRFSEKNQEVTHAIGKRALELASVATEPEPQTTPRTSITSSANPTTTSRPRRVSRTDPLGRRTGRAATRVAVTGR